MKKEEERLIELVKLGERGEVLENLLRGYRRSGRHVEAIELCQGLEGGTEPLYGYLDNLILDDLVPVRFMMTEMMNEVVFEEERLRLPNKVLSHFSIYVNAMEVCGKKIKLTPLFNDIYYRRISRDLRGKILKYMLDEEMPKDYPSYEDMKFNLKLLKNSVNDPRIRSNLVKMNGRNLLQPRFQEIDQVGSFIEHSIIRVLENGASPNLDLSIREKKVIFGFMNRVKKRWKGISRIVMRAYLGLD